MAAPAPSRRWYLFAAALLLLGAAFLRLHQIDRRPLHADEAVQAYQTWRLLRGDGYTYDPADRHGPFLYYAAAGVAKISGWSPAVLDETRLRSVTLLAGLGTIAVLLGSSARLGRGAALLGTALLAAAPLAVIYDTYFVQEAWLCFFTWALFFAVMRWWEAPTLAGAVLSGALAGLMQATKETSVLHFATLGVALVATRIHSADPARTFHLPNVPDERSALRSGDVPVAVNSQPATGTSPLHKIAGLGRHWAHLLAALLTAVFVYVLFYSSFLTHWAGVADGLRAYAHYAARASGSAHDQPWTYYFAMLWPHARDGVRWGEPLLLFMAAAGAAFACTPRATATQRAIAVFTLALLLLYSAIPYKTPWLLLTPYVGLALLAGLGAVQSAAGLPANLARVMPAVLGLVILGAGVWRNFPALGRYANDERNPYVYQPTSSDLPRLVAAVGALPAGKKVAVVSPDHAWPLPWYWRDRAATGYFAAPPANVSDYDLVLFDSRLESPLPEGFAAYGLRPNVVLWCKAQ